jgi:hypothetical protein
MNGHDYKMQNYVVVEVGGGVCAPGGRAQMSHLDATTRSTTPPPIRRAACAALTLTLRAMP